MATPHNLTSGKLLVRNTILNLLGQGMPLIVAFFAIPILIKSLGTDRFGIISVAWMLIGYFSLFDMGLGLALTQLVSDKLGKHEQEAVPAIFWTSLFLMLVFGTIGALAIALLAPILVFSVLKIPLVLQNETLHALYVLASSIPFVILTAALIGFLSAFQRFDIISSIRVPMGSFMFIGPLLVLPFSKSLVLVICVLTIARVCGFAIYFYFCLRVMPELRTSIIFKRSIVKPLFKFGGWMTVANVAGPFLVYIDRFLIGSLVSITAVAYYTTPYDMVTKLWFIPSSLVNVLFPAFATSFSQDKTTTTKLFERANKYIYLVMLPITLLIVIFAADCLNLWLGSAFSANSKFVLQWIMIGVFINSLAQVPFVLVQGMGRTELIAKILLVQLPFYLAGLWFLIVQYGIKGAAIAWTVRVLIDTVLFYWMAARILVDIKSIVQKMVVCLVFTTIVLVCMCAIESFYVKCIFLGLSYVTLIVIGWNKILDLSERSLVKEKFARYLH